MYGAQAVWDLLERLGHDIAAHDIPIIIVSTSLHILDEACDNPARFGAQRFLRKPFDLNELVKMVKELIGPA